MVIKVIMLVVFFGIMIGVGFYARKQATDVNGFVLGGRSVGPWLTAFAYGTSYFRQLFYWICRTVWMEIRNCIHMDRNWKCDPWISACMGSAWQKNQTDHAEAGFQNNAGIL